jgi:peptidoglycan/LPS O-acetylase OafA/YrhL
VWPAVILLVPLRHLLRLCVSIVLIATAVRFAMAALGASWAAIFTVTFARMDAIAMGATIAVIARSPVGLSTVKRWAPIIGVIALAVLGLIDIFWRISHWSTGRLAIHCTLFVWLWGALVVGTLTAVPGSFLQRFTYMGALRNFGKYSYALYLFHGHINRLFEKIGFNPGAGPVIAGSMLPWQMVYLAASISASFAVAYLSWHLYEKHFLRLKVFFPTPKITRPPSASTLSSRASKPCETRSPAAPASNT